MSSFSAPLRRTRTVVISAVTVALAAGAHVLAGGMLPEPAVLLVMALAITAPIGALTSRKLPAAAMAAILGAGQLILHEALVQLSMQHDAGMGTHSHGVAGAASPMMFAAHVLATIGTAIVLAHNEAALFALAGWLRPLVRLPRVQSRPLTPLVSPALIVRYVPAPWSHLKIRPLRGPPQVCTTEL